MRNQLILSVLFMSNGGARQYDWYGRMSPVERSNYIRTFKLARMRSRFSNVPALPFLVKAFYDEQVPGVRYEVALLLCTIPSNDRDRALLVEARKRKSAGQYVHYGDLAVALRYPARETHKDLLSMLRQPVLTANDEGYFPLLRTIGSTGDTQLIEKAKSTVMKGRLLPLESFETWIARGLIFSKRRPDWRGRFIEPRPPLK
jgi:hypothetical protein